MGDNVIIGYDGKPRCAWAGAGDTAAGRYHDEVWGTRTYDESALFEALTLGVFEAGLSWSIVFGKRDAFWRAFHGFDITQVAAFFNSPAGKKYVEVTPVFLQNLSDVTGNWREKLSTDILERARAEMKKKGVEF